MQSRLAFIVGAESSGKHWLWRCLSTHPQILGIPETHAFLMGTRPEPSALAQVRNIDFWRVVRQSIDPGSHVDDGSVRQSDEHAANEAPSSGIDAFLHRVDAPRMQQLSSVLHRLPSFATWEEVFGEVMSVLDGVAPALVEKSPGHVFYINRIRARFPDARFVGVVRDGRNVYAASARNRRLWHLEPLDLKAAAMRWLRSTSTLIRTQSQLPDQVLVVRHEDFIAHRVEKVAEICAFLGVEVKAETVQLMVDTNTFNTAHESPRSGEPGGIELTDEIDYSEVLREADIATFESLTSPMLERLQYPVRHFAPGPPR